MTDQYSEGFLEKETGQIEWTSDMTMSREEIEEISDKLDEHGFYRLPTSYDIREYDIMEEFVGDLKGSVLETLSSAILVELNDIANVLALSRILL